MPQSISDNPIFCRQLTTGLERLGFSPEKEREQKLLRYLELLIRWNKTYNLTAITDPETMIYRHLLDSLAVARHIKGRRFVDIGSGAGLPGIPLAIWQADNSFVLLDSNGKKTRFLVQAKLELGLNNVEVIHSRVENYQPEARFDGILTRAFSSLADMVLCSEHLLLKTGVYYAMKGRLDQQELSALPKAYTLRATRELDIPGGVEQRHLLELISTEQNQ